jgi:hypothetical protein
VTSATDGATMPRPMISTPADRVFPSAPNRRLRRRRRHKATRIEPNLGTQLPTLRNDPSPVCVTCCAARGRVPGEDLFVWLSACASMPSISRVVAPGESSPNALVPDASSYKTIPRQKTSPAAVMGRRIPRSWQLRAYAVCFNRIRAPDMQAHEPAAVMTSRLCRTHAPFVCPTLLTGLSFEAMHSGRRT